METLEGILNEHRFFHDLPERHRELVAGCASNVRFQAGQFIFHEGEEANKFYLIREGKVLVHIYSERRGALAIQTLEDCECL